jgi:queuine tRNA-ribosyltransferase
MTISFNLHHTDGKARAGILYTTHGACLTPMFMPVGTQATVKGVAPRELEDMGAMMILSNTYHLYLRPGDELIARRGGLHNFMQWRGPILTDSGGFQVFSLSDMRKIDDDGVTFKSHRDGSKHRFTPEKSIQIQHNLGADVIMCFDECPEPSDFTYNVKALKRTHTWAERSLREHERLCAAPKFGHTPALFGIVQGGVFRELREQSAQFITALDLPGYAIGGLAVGESKAQMHGVLEWMHPLLPSDKPRYLMGVGDPIDLINGVLRGIDMFDCVLPTRLARHGAAFTRTGRINMRNVKFAEDDTPIDPACKCYTCQTFTKAYIRHLLHVEEMLGLLLMSLHNLHFLLRQMEEIRASILANTFADYAARFISAYKDTASAGSSI